MLISSLVFIFIFLLGMKTGAEVAVWVLEYDLSCGEIWFCFASIGYEYWFPCDCSFCCLPLSVGEGQYEVPRFVCSCAFDLSVREDQRELVRGYIFLRYVSLT
ncbi:hypothetical protein Drorol1_Dr00000228 [Drosera rotundifolia]